MSNSDTEKFELYKGFDERAEKGTVSSAAKPYELESIEFMTQEGEELVDLDALFDALNLVAKENSEAISYSDDPDQEGGILTVTNDALATVGVSSVLDDVNSVTSEGIQDHIVSDES